jgi:hypothetical protein
MSSCGRLNKLSSWMLLLSGCEAESNVAILIGITSNDLDNYACGLPFLSLDPEMFMGIWDILHLNVMSVMILKK